MVLYAQIWRSASAHLCLSSTKSCRHTVRFWMDLACCDLLKTVRHPSFHGQLVRGRLTAFAFPYLNVLELYFALHTHNAVQLRLLHHWLPDQSTCLPANITFNPSRRTGDIFIIRGGIFMSESKANASPYLPRIRLRSAIAILRTASPWRLYT